MLTRTRVLRRQLRKAVVDHVSDSFLEPDNPLLLLIRAAQEVMGCFVLTLAAICLRLSKSRYRQRFFDQVGHETTYASSETKHFFTK